MNPILPPAAPRPPAAITIIGLGPGAADDLTLAAWRAWQTAPRILLRTRRHPSLPALAAALPDPAIVQDCDDLYEQHADFADVYTAITARVLDAARLPGGVLYAVPGHPWVGEITTRQLLAAAADAGLTTLVLGGGSFLEAVAAAVGLDLMDGSQVIDAMLLARQHHPQVEVGLPLLIGQLYSRALASDVKLTLLNAYPDDHPVTLVRAAGTPAQVVIPLPLHTLDHGDDFDHLTSLYVPPLTRGSFSDLHELIAHLRAPEGCPWDQSQTLESLRQDLLGECIEVLEAIDAEADGRDNSLHIAEELGDLYLVATMLVQIATEEGRFRLATVVDGIVAKLIRRHPHVFGDAVVSGIDQLYANWDAIKAAEKAAKGQAVAGPLDGIPAQLPALEKARVLQHKAHKAKLLDRAALAQRRAGLLGPTPTADALGALLWEIVALAHAHDLNAEDALRAYAVAFRQQHPA